MLHTTPPHISTDRHIQCLCSASCCIPRFLIALKREICCGKQWKIPNVLWLFRLYMKWLENCLLNVSEIAVRKIKTCFSAFSLMFPHVSHSASPDPSGISYVSPQCFSLFPILGLTVKKSQETIKKEEETIRRIIFSCITNKMA